MDYVEFVDEVLARFEREDQDSPAGLLIHTLVGASRREDVSAAFLDLHHLGVVEVSGSFLWVKPTKLSRRIKHGGMTLHDLWPGFFGEWLTEDQEAFLAKAVEMADRHDESGAAMVELDAAAVYDELGWARREPDPYRLTEALASAGFLDQSAFLDGHITIRPRYAGVVRATQKRATEWQKLLRELLAEGETASMDIKQSLSVGSRSEKAEFVRDVLGLATTRLSGSERYLVIGYDDDTHEFVESVDPKLSRDQLEQIVNAYTDPKPEVDWVTVPVPQGTAGLVVIRRDPTRVPYRVSTKIGKLDVGNVYVRHGTQTEAPTGAELAALEAEGRRARGET